MTLFPGLVRFCMALIICPILIALFMFRHDHLEFNVNYQQCQLIDYTQNNLYLYSSHSIQNKHVNCVNIANDFHYENMYQYKTLF